jgi:hypothetical protein
MQMTHDIYLRAHVVRPEPKSASDPTDPSWPHEVLVFDTETTLDTQQQLKLGVFRRCHLVGHEYHCVEEGIFYGDNVNHAERTVVEQYAAEHHAEIGVKSFPPKLQISVHSRSTFIESVFWKVVKRGGLIVAFNLPFDLSRLAADWRTARDGGWSLILSLRKSRRTGRQEPNPERPRIRVTARNSKSAFISLTKTVHPAEWPHGRFLDVHTLAFALYGHSYSLNSLCDELGIKGKADHEPSGQVTEEEIAYCRQDVRATVDCLNALRVEFDRHPVKLHPDRAFSPASMAKAYLDAMGLVPPLQKFNISNDVLGVAMEAYYGGRAECRIRRTEVPVVHTDFTSEYPTVNALLGNWEVLTAAELVVEDVTEQVRTLLSTVTLAETLKADFWRKLSFFALVRPNDDVFPVRTFYNGETRNIGLNYLTSAEPMWFAGPDCVNSVLQTSGKAPSIERAFRLVPRGRQPGLRATNLRGMVAIDPARHDFFRHVVEQRQHHKASDEALGDFLKTLGNSGSYGAFVEVTPKAHRRPVPIQLFEGEQSRTVSSRLVEEHGRWYFPPVAALIAAGGRLLLGMLERCVRDAGGTYLFCDTDSLCVVSAEREQLFHCEGGDQRLGGRAAIKALSWKHLERIRDRFVALNPYNSDLVEGSILKIEDINYKKKDGKRQQRQLFGFAVSAKRYVLYQRSGNALTLIEPKAHGLGYLSAPVERKNETDPLWTHKAWELILCQELGIPMKGVPEWLHLPALMRVTLSTPLVLERINRQTRPFSFFFCVLVDPLIGYPLGADRDHSTFIARYTKHREDWLDLSCINVYDGRAYQLALQQTEALDRVIPQTFGSVLRLYNLHPESKSLAPDGSPGDMHTRGLLRRAQVIAGARRFIGKETDRRWEFGDDLSLNDFRVQEYAEIGGTMVASDTLRTRMRTLGRRESMRLTGLSQHTLERIERGDLVKAKTLRRMTSALN